MKKKYIDMIFMGILLCILLSLPTLSNYLMDTIINASTKAPMESPAFIEESDTRTRKSLSHELSTMTQHERNMVAREFHSNYEKLVEAMLTLRGQGYFTGEEISNIHEYIEKFNVTSTSEMPYTDKDLLEYLYDNNIITKAQYRQIMDLLDEDD